MHIEQFDPKTDIGRLRACFEMTLAGWPADHPDEPQWTYDAFAGKWARGYDTAPRQTWLASDESGEPVGGYLLRLPDKDNIATAYCRLVISPARRRAGFGRALLAHCADQARQAGRSRLTSHVRDDTAGAAFAAVAGAHGGIPEVIRMLIVDDAMPARLTQLRAGAEPYAAGYSLLSWLGVTPAELLDQVAAVRGAMADAPRNDGMEPSAWTADRVLQSEQNAGDNAHMIAVNEQLGFTIAGVSRDWELDLGRQPATQS